MSFDKNIAHLARGLRRRRPFEEAVPPGLRARVLAALADPAPVSVKGAAPHLSRRRALTAAFALAVAGAGLIAGPRLLVRSALAAQVKAAVTRANTWHLSGWRLKEGKKLRWEVWGRRSPFFYREQVGDAVLIDDGQTRTQVLPAEGPSKWSVGRPGAVLIRHSLGQATLAPSGDPRAGILVGLGAETDDLHFAADPSASDAADTVTLASTTQYGAITLVDETTRLTVDRETRLPLRYSVERTESKPAGTPETGLDVHTLTPLGRSTVAQLTAAYDVPLPSGIERYTPPADYAVADMTRPAPITEARQGNDIASAGGLTLKGKVVGRDPDGNLFVEFHGWIGAQPMNFRLIPLSLHIDRGIGTGLGRDETGRIYVQVGDQGIIYGERPRLWLAPLHPLGAGAAPRPRSVTVRLSVQLSDYERLGNSGRSVLIVTEPMTFTLALPREDTDLDYDAPEQWEQPGRVEHIGRIPTFREQIATARRAYSLPYQHQLRRR